MLEDVLASERARSEQDVPADASTTALAVWDAAVNLPADPRLASAYAAGHQSGHAVEHAGVTLKIRDVAWRTQVVCWAAEHASRLTGSFVECRFDVGFFALAACQYVDFGTLDRDFYVIDSTTAAPTMAGTEPACCGLLERSLGAYPQTHLIRGVLPESLRQAGAECVSYLGLDVRLAAPELGVLDFYWSRLVAGGVVVLEGYGWQRYASQADLVRRFARAHGASILLLPTGQGLIIRP
jgi:hypothetical protein